jgi:hypothetical protein
MVVTGKIFMKLALCSKISVKSLRKSDKIMAPAVSLRMEGRKSGRRDREVLILILFVKERVTP